MNQYCYVLVEEYLNGCRAAINIVGVTLDQQYSYNWINMEKPEFVQRTVQQVLFYPTAP